MSTNELYIKYVPPICLSCGTRLTPYFVYIVFSAMKPEDIFARFRLKTCCRMRLYKPQLIYNRPTSEHTVLIDSNVLPVSSIGYKISGYNRNINEVYIPDDIQNALRDLMRRKSERSEI